MSLARDLDRVGGRVHVHATRGELEVTSGTVLETRWPVLGRRSLHVFIPSWIRRALSRLDATLHFQRLHPGLHVGLGIIDDLRDLTGHVIEPSVAERDHGGVVEAGRLFEGVGEEVARPTGADLQLAGDLEDVPACPMQFEQAGG